MTKEAPIAKKVYTISDKFLVVSLNNTKTADFEAMDDADREQLKNRLLAEKKQRVVAEKLKQLVQHAEIEIMVPELSGSLTNGGNKS